MPNGTDTALTQLLQSAQADQMTKAQAWELFNRSADQKDFESKLQPLKLPQQTKAQLWEMKYGGRITQPLTPRYFNPAGLKAQAQAESGGDPTARSKTSSASGKYQFLDQTWAKYQDQYNRQHGTQYNFKSAADAPEQVQDQIAGITPASNWGGKWAGGQGKNATNPAYLQTTPPVQSAAKIQPSYNPNVGPDRVQVQLKDGRIRIIPKSELRTAMAQGAKVYSAPSEAEKATPQIPKWYGFTPSNVLQNLYQGGKDVVSSLPATLGALDPTTWSGKEGFINKYGLVPAQQQFALGKQEIAAGNKLPGYLHELLAQYVPFAGPLIGSLGEQAGRGDIGGAASKAAAYAATPKVIEKGVGTGLTYTAGLPAFIREGREGAAIHAANRLDGAMADLKPKIQSAVKNVETEVGTHANAIATADEAHTPQGSINIRNIGNDARDSDLRQAATAMPKLDRALKQTDTVAQTPTVSWRTAQQLRSDIGSALSEARQSGKVRESGILYGMYKDLSTKLSDRAAEIGMSESWTKYNRLHQRLRTLLDDGPIGDALGKDNGLQFFKALNDPAQRGALQSHIQSLARYGLDSRDLRNTLDEVKPSYAFAGGAERSYLKYLGTRMGIGALLSGAGVPHGFMFGMAAGLIGPRYATILRELGTPMGRFAEPLRTLRGSQDLPGPSMPPTPTPPTTTAPTELPKPQQSPSTAVPREEYLGVPLSQQPLPGENPMANMLREIWAETETPAKQAELEQILKEELEKAGARTRARSRTAEAMSEVRMARKKQ